MKNNILLSYSYLVCFAAVVCGAIYTGIFLYDIVEISAPEFMLSECTKQTHTNNENFLERNYTYSDGKKINKYEGYSDEKVTKIRKENYLTKIAQEKSKAIKSMIQSIIILLVNSVLFFIHWRITKNIKDKE